MLRPIIDTSFFGGANKRSSPVTLKIRGQFFDKSKVKRLLDDANRIALSRCGVQVQQAAHRAIGQRAPARTVRWARQIRLGELREINGGLYKDVTPYNSGKPRKAGQPVRSWLPKRFLYKSLRFYYQRGYVIIGPERADWLGRLHEYGGTERLTAYGLAVDQARTAMRRRSRGRPLGRYANGQPRAGVVLWSHRSIRTGRLWEKLGPSRTIRYPKRPYMGSKAVATQLTKLPKEFKDTVRGPGRRI